MNKKYSEVITKGRKTIEANVIGCLFKDILLVKEYNIKDKDFVSEEGKFYFGIIKSLSEKNVSEVTDTDIRMTVSDDIIQQYKKYKGFQTVEHLRNAIDVKNFSYYLDELYKKNLLMSLVDDGFDIEKPIDLELKNKTITNSLVGFIDEMKMTSEEIVNFLQVRLASKDIVAVNNYIEESDGFIDDDFLEELKEGKEMGVLFDNIGEDINGKIVTCLPSLSKEILGLKRNTLSMLGAFVNVGKTTLLSNIILALASKKEKILVITNEMKVKDFKIAFLIYCCSTIMCGKTITKKKIKMGALNEEEKVLLQKAKEEYNKRFAPYITICSIPDSNMDMVDRLTRKYALSKNCSVLVYDTFKQNFDKNGDVSYKDLIKDSRHAERLCKQYNMIGLCAIQLSQQYLGNLVLDLSMLAGAKQVNEILWNLFMMRTVYDQELDEKNDKYYIRPFTFVKEETTGKWIKKPIKLDKTQTYRVIFLTKTREGETFDDSGTAYLVKFDGRHGVFKEVCLCEPKRTSINQHNK